MFKRVAWPSDHWDSMNISGGVKAAYSRVIREADDQAQAEGDRGPAGGTLVALPHRGEAFNIEEILDPRETKPMVCEFIDTAQAILETQLGQSPTVYMP
jgi:hypothetical protein